jgi:hypothetical protein
MGPGGLKSMPPINDAEALPVCQGPARTFVRDRPPRRLPAGL